MNNHMLQGVRAALPMTLVITPFGLLYGVVGAASGFSLAQTMGMTIMVIAGASQFSATQMLTEGAPFVIILLTGLAINLRMMMYSASISPHLGRAPLWSRALISYALIDQTYAITERQYVETPDMTLAAKVAFFAGTCIPIVPPWYLSTWIGATFGTTFPDDIGLDFAIPITFIALFSPAMRRFPHAGAALAASLSALALYRVLPYQLWLIVAGLVGMVTGALLELWQDRRYV